MAKYSGMRQRGKGKIWHAHFKQGGKLHRFSLETTDAALASDILARKRAELVEIKHGLRKPKQSSRWDKMAFKDAATEFLDDYKLTRRHKSWKRWQTAFNQLPSSIKNKLLADVTRDDFANWKSRRLRDGIKLATVSHDLKFVNGFYNWLKRNGYAGDNPLVGSKLIESVDNGRTRFLSEAEERRLLNCCPKYLYPVVLFALHTGFRTSEIRNMRWQYVDFRNSIVTCIGTYSKNGATQSVEMSETLAKVLRPLARGKRPSDNVFLSRHGQPYKDWTTSFRKACERAGLDDVSFHTLRHTFISRLALKADFATVKKLARHKSDSQTAAYMHISQSHVRQVIRNVFDVPNEKPLGDRPRPKRDIILQ